MLDVCMFFPEMSSSYKATNKLTKALVNFDNNTFGSSILTLIKSLNVTLLINSKLVRVIHFKMHNSFTMENFHPYLLHRNFVAQNFDQ